jgi:citrate lyase subunit beta/citryl-CoA lyase
MIHAATFLFVPGDRPDRFAKALSSGADCVIIDLEDAVQPHAKGEARQATLAADIDWARVAVRINDATSLHFEDDRQFLRACAAPMIILPKAESPHTVAQIRAACARDVEIIIMIETVRGLANMASLLSAPGVQRAAFGHLDFALDLGCATDWEALLFTRSQMAFQSRLAGVLPPIDSVTTDYKNAEAAAADAAAARRLGFGGKFLIHPNQIAPVAAAFMPTASEVAWAEKVIAASQGKHGAVSLEGKMIDKPVIECAQRIVARAKSN